MAKKDPSIELAECLRVLAIQGAEADELWQVAQRLRQQAKNLEMYNVPAPPHADNRKADRYKQYETSLCDHQNQIAGLRAEAASAEARLEKLQPVVTAARKRAGELRQAIEAERNTRCGEAVRKAAEAAPSRMQHLTEQNRLVALRKKVSETQEDLDRLLSDPPTDAELAEQRVAELLASGDFSSLQAKDASALIKELRRKVREGHAAIGRQQDVVNRVQRRFCDEVTKNLKTTLNELVSRIATGHDQALQATLEAGILRQEYNRCTGDGDCLPVFVSPSIQGHEGAASVWEMQLAKWRQQGFAV